jgi:hypothetical protein
MAYQTYFSRKFPNLISVSILTVLLALCTSAAQADKWGLLIGINEYAYDGIPDLKGCEHDVDLVQKVLTTKYGFPEGNIKIILSADATKANMVAAIRSWLIEKPKAGDVVVLYYSGHGVQIEDVNGDEDDGYDEALCPTDTAPNAAATEFVNVLLDDELNQLLSQIPTDNVTVVLDCCHSGTATKDLVLVGRSRSRVIHRDLYLAPKPPRKPPPTADQREGVTVEVDNNNHVVITGCRDDEVSQERTWPAPDGNSFRSGVLTKNLTDELKQNPPTITYSELMSKVRQKIGTGAVQTPQIYGDTSRSIFSTRQNDGGITPISAVTAKPYVLVKEASNDTIILNEGSIHGVTKGSIYAVFPPNTEDFSGKEIDHIEITKVALDSSTAVPLQKRPLRIEELSPIVPTCRAVELKHAFPKDSLYVLVDTGLQLQVENFIRQLAVENVVPVSDEQRADFIVQLKPEGATLISAEGQVVLEVSGVSTAQIAEKLRRTFEREVLIKLLHTFRNPNPPFGLKVWVNKAENPVYKIGELLSMSFRAEKNCYLLLFNIDSEGYVTQMFPNKFRSDNRISAGRTYTIPSAEMQFQIRTHPPAGRELVMAIATTERLSHPIFQMESQTELFPDLTGVKLGTELIRILSQSLQGNITASSVSLPNDKWVADSVIVVLVP